MVTKKTKKKAIPPIQLREDEIPFWNRTISKVKDPEESQDVATKNYVDTQGGSGASYTAGANITIENNVISATDTTYSDFTGTDGTEAGTAGLVPAPATTDADKFLKSDGTWGTAGGGGGIPTDATLWGQSYDVTSNSVKGDITLNPSITTAETHQVKSTNSTTASAIEFTKIDGTTSIITLKPNINYSNRNNIVQATTSSLYLGGNIALNMDNSQIHNVGDPTSAQDAVTKAYVDAIYPVGTVIMSTADSVPNIAGGTWTLIGSQTIGSTPKTVNYFERTA